MNHPNTLADFYGRWVVMDDGCWNYLGTPCTNGYPQFHMRGVAYMANRISWEFHKGPIPDGKWVLHTCDNRMCVNPDHLFIGDRQDNINDMHNKRRAVNQVGDKNHNSKLYSTDVKKIKDQLAQGKTCAELAKEYNVSWTTIKFIKTGKTWANI